MSIQLFTIADALERVNKIYSCIQQPIQREREIEREKTERGKKSKRAKEKKREKERAKEKETMSELYAYRSIPTWREGMKDSQFDFNRLRRRVVVDLQFEMSFRHRLRGG